MSEQNDPERGARADAEAPVALVTGASRGFGAAVAEALGARGWRVIATARTVGGLEALDDRIRAAGGAPALIAPLDLTDGPGVDRLGAALFERYGRLDLLVHAAAQGATLTSVAHLDPKFLEDLARLNVFAAQRLLRALEIPLKAAPAPRAVFLDDAPRTGEAYWGAHAACKLAQEALVRAFAAERPEIDTRLHRPAPMDTAVRARTHPGEDKTALASREDEALKLLAALGIA